MNYKGIEARGVEARGKTKMMDCLVVAGGGSQQPQEGCLVYGGEAGDDDPEAWGSV